MYRGEVSVHRACCEQATQPYLLGGGGTFIQAQDQQVLPHVVRGCNRLLIHSLDVN